MRDLGVPFHQGDIVAGRYRVEALLGRGGFGVVYRAVQLDAGREVALKVLLAEALDQADSLARFRREAELAQRLEHPNTVRLHDFGETERGLPFIAWEMLRGRSLDEVIRAEGGLATPRVAVIAVQALKALMEAHQRGVVHRDVKPSNLFLCQVSGERDFVKVLDFGIAKSLSAGAGLTQDGAILGTPGYMAPEQVASGDVTPATDLYALGLVMAEAIAGRPVFAGDSGLAVCMAQLSDAPVPLPPVVLASPLAAVITRATRKAPAARFASAAEMLAQIEASTPSLSVTEALPAVPSLAGPAAERPALPPIVSVRPARTLVELAETLPEGTSSDDLRLRYAALAPTPAPRATVRRSLLLAGAVGAVVALGAAIAALVLIEREPLLDEPARAGKTHGAGIGPLVGRRFGSLTPAQVRARIEDAGYRVALETSSDSATYWMLEPHPLSDGNTVMLSRSPDSASADVVYRLRRSQGGAVARDGNAVLYVKQPQQAAADTLLQRLIR